MAYLSGIFFKAVGIDNKSDTWADVIVSSLFSILLAFILYSPIITVGFYGILILLDVVCFHFLKMKVWKVLLLEWILIIPPFIVWAFEYDFWIWIAMTLSFLITQLIRKKEIEQIISFGV